MLVAYDGKLRGQFCITFSLLNKSRPSRPSLFVQCQVPSQTCSLSKRDAVAFVRAVRRYGLQSRLADIASEVGGAVESAEPQAQQLLWSELADGCRRALDMAAEQDKQQGQLHDPRVSISSRLREALA